MRTTPPDIRRLVDQAPRLTEAVKARLAVALRPGIQRAQLAETVR